MDQALQNCFEQLQTCLSGKRMRYTCGHQLWLSSLGPLSLRRHTPHSLSVVGFWVGPPDYSSFWPCALLGAPGSYFSRTQCLLKPYSCPHSQPGFYPRTDRKVGQFVGYPPTASPFGTGSISALSQVILVLKGGTGEGLFSVCPPRGWPWDIYS